MTLYDAVKADLLNYTASRATINKALEDAGLSPDTVYVPVTHKTSVATIVIDLLRRFVNLQSESEGGLSQAFNIDGLKGYICNYADKHGLGNLVTDLSIDNINDKSDIW